MSIPKETEIFKRLIEEMNELIEMERIKPQINGFEFRENQEQSAEHQRIGKTYG